MSKWISIFQIRVAIFALPIIHASDVVSILYVEQHDNGAIHLDVHDIPCVQTL